MQFKDNICPSIEQIFQRKTYHGLLEGVPNTAINQGMLHRVVEKGKRLFEIDRIHLIRPTENIQTFRSGEQIKVTCIAELVHD